jgi:hypothetical protein
MALAIGISFGTRSNLIMALNSQPYFGQVTIRISFRKVKIGYTQTWGNWDITTKWEIYKDSSQSKNSDFILNGSNFYFPMEKSKKISETERPFGFCRV